MKFTSAAASLFAGTWIALASSASPRESFEVSDSIQMTRLVDPSSVGGFGGPAAFKVSPDGQRVALVLKQGDLASGLNTYSLDIIETSAVVSYLNKRDRQQASPPSLRHAATFKSSSEWDAIDQVQWLPDSQRVLFVGRQLDEPGQLYSFDVGEQMLLRLTNQETNVMRFALSVDEKTLVYAAHAYPDWSQRNDHGYALQSDYVGYMMLTNPQESVPAVRYYSKDMTSKQVRRLELDTSRYPEAIALSPSGQLAALVSYDVFGIPSEWLSYNYVRWRANREVITSYDGAAIEPKSYNNDAFGEWSNWLAHAYIVDVRTGQARRLMSAPAIPAAGFRMVWHPSGRRVLLLNTLLPRNDPQDGASAAADEDFAITEVDVATGRSTVVAAIPAGDRALDATWTKDNELNITMLAADRHGTARMRYMKERDRWMHTGTSSSRGDDDEQRQRVRYSIEQSMDRAPDIAALDTKTGKQKLITDLNPQLRHLRMGEVRLFDWTDRLSRTFKGGLFVPDDYQPDKRYPVVLQTYGFDPGNFLVDGPYGITSAYAARALVSHGIVVLQMPLRDTQSSQALAPAGTQCEKWEDCGENPRFMAMVDGAVDALLAKQIADPERIGIIGFSREGMHVFHAVTFSSHRFAAATIADSISPTPFAYALMYGDSYPGMLQNEQSSVIGAPLWGDDMRIWSRRSPFFNLTRIKTALRFENYGRAIPGYWDAFAVLRRQRRPVEMIHLPLGSHVLNAPFARYTSQQGTVDWLRFWLKDEVDDDPRKAEQYVRWRRLRQDDRMLR